MSILFPLNPPPLVSRRARWLTALAAAVAAVLAAGAVTADLGGELGTRAATEAVIDAIRAIHWAAAHRVQMHWA